eukprot:5042796-Prymnesium_polylepis.1
MRGAPPPLLSPECKLVRNWRVIFLRMCMFHVHVHVGVHVRDAVTLCADPDGDARVLSVCTLGPAT